MKNIADRPFAFSAIFDFHPSCAGERSARESVALEAGVDARV